MSVLPASRFATLLLVAMAAAAVIGGALVIERMGFPPCDLCLEQRPAYYFGAPFAALLAFTERRGFVMIIAAGLVLLALIFLANAALGVYHSGVEWHFWQGPTACTGGQAMPDKVEDLLKQLQTIKVVRCDEVQLRILGLSLANANVIASAVLAALSGRAVALK